MMASVHTATLICILFTTAVMLPISESSYYASSASARQNPGTSRRTQSANTSSSSLSATKFSFKGNNSNGGKGKPPIALKKTVTVADLKSPCETNFIVVQCCSKLGLNYQLNKGRTYGATTNLINTCCYEFCNKIEQLKMNLDENLLRSICEEAVYFVYRGADIAYLLNIPQLNPYERSILLTALIQTGNTIVDLEQRSISNLFQQQPKNHVWIELLRQVRINSNDVSGMLWCKGIPKYYDTYNAFFAHSRDYMHTDDYTDHYLCTFREIKWIMMSYCEAGYQAKIQEITMDENRFISLACAACREKFVSYQYRESMIKAVIYICVRLQVNTKFFAVLLYELETYHYEALYGQTGIGWSLERVLFLAKRTCLRVYNDNGGSHVIQYSDCIINWVNIGYRLKTKNVPFSLINTDYAYINGCIPDSINALWKVIKELVNQEHGLSATYPYLFKFAEQFIYFYIGFWDVNDDTSVNNYKNALKNSSGRRDQRSTHNTINAVQNLAGNYIKECGMERPNGNKANYSRCVFLYRNIRTTPVA